MNRAAEDAELTFAGLPEPAPTHLKRALKPRHLNMIAIGGSIGTGLFVASGSTVATAGPGGALLAYALIGAMVFFLMNSLGELAAHMPDSGSFCTYGSRFVDEGFGFAMGWNYWYNWAVTIAAELVASQIVMSFWFPDVPGIYWSALFLAIILLLNFFSVKGFGESEFWFALIKVVAVIVFIAIGLASIIGIMRGIPSPGFSNFTVGEAPFVGGLQAMIGVAMIAGFSFQGTELIGVAAGESENPRRSIPIAIRQVFWRILMFYVLSIFVIGMLIPYTDPNLLKTGDTSISTSPFTLLFERAGLAAAASVMNAVILSALLSAGNSGMYASTRMLYTMALKKQAPGLFATQWRTPLRALRDCADRRALLPDELRRQQEDVRLAPQYLRHVRIHHLAGHCDLALPVPEGLRGSGRESAHPALHRALVPVSDRCSRSRCASPLPSARTTRPSSATGSTGRGSPPPTSHFRCFSPSGGAIA